MGHSIRESVSILAKGVQDGEITQDQSDTMWQVIDYAGEEAAKKK